MARTPIKKLRAVVEIDIYEGDDVSDGTARWFEYRKPGITDYGTMGVCKRDVTLVSYEVIELPKEKAA